MSAHKRTFKELFTTPSFFYKLDKLFDATVIGEDGVEFRAHKLFLSERSEYFKEFFKNNFGDMKDVANLAFHSGILEKILLFVYTGEVYLDNESIVEVITAADFLLIDALLMKCRDFVLQNISLDICIPLLMVFNVVERLQLKEYCFRFVQVNFGNLVHRRSSDIAEISLDIFKTLIGGNSLGVPSEETVWKAIVIWVNRDPTSRLKNVPEFLSCIHWSEISYWSISCIAMNPIFKDNEFCRGIHLKKLVSTSDQFTGRFPQKAYIFVSKKLYLVPDSSETTEIFLTYDDHLDIWRKIGETKYNFNSFVIIGYLIFMFNTFSNTMKAFDLITKKWCDKNTMRSASKGYLIVQGQNQIFVVGGFIGMTNIHVSLVEYYDPISDLWSYIAPLPSITICGASSLRGRLHVIGYTESTEILEMRALAYDAADGTWTYIGAPKQFRTNFALTNYRERLFIVGGLTEAQNVTTRVEEYIPERNDWDVFPSVPFMYQQPQAVVLKDKLIVYDDFSGAFSVPRLPPSTWNEQTKSWDVEDFSSPYNKIHQYQFCCVDDRYTLRELTKENRDSKTIWSKTSLSYY